MATKANFVHFVACLDDDGCSCLQVDRVGSQVKYIPLDLDGLVVLTTNQAEFDRWHKPQVNYPAAKACQLYLSYAQELGATKEALSYLGQVINVSKQEAEMATKKQASKAAVTPTTIKVVKPATKATAKTVAPKAKAAPAEKPVAKAAKADGTKKPSAAQMFQELIMAGKLTDDQIFEKVQAEFGLDEKKRGYVKWYRNHLAKQGLNPPAAKG